MSRWSCRTVLVGFHQNLCTSGSRGDYMSSVCIGSKKNLKCWTRAYFCYSCARYHSVRKDSLRLGFGMSNRTLSMFPNRVDIIIAK